MKYLTFFKKKTIVIGVVLNINTHAILSKNFNIGTFAFMTFRELTKAEINIQ